MTKWILLLALLCSTPSHAQVLGPAADGLPGLQVNGCGARDGIKVPDNLLGCKLEESCNNVSVGSAPS